MPDIGVYHPQIVHFVIGFLCLGVVARVLSLLPLGERFRFLGPMAATLLMYCPNDCGRLARRSAAGTRMVLST